MAEDSTYIMAAGIQALDLGLDYAFLVKDIVNEILGTSIQLKGIIDSKTVLNVVAKDGKTTERRLHIDVLELHQSYYIVELDRISCIRGNINPTESLKNPVLNATSLLYKRMNTTKFLRPPE